MDKYYYLISQLPYLQFNYPPLLDQNRFLQEAEKWLNKKDFSILLEVNINEFVVKEEYPSSLKEYQKFEYKLRNQLLLFRRARQNNEEYKLSDRLKELISLGNPLKVERALLQYRWDYLEELKKEHYFDLDFLIIFYLKLQILELLFSFNKKSGKEKFEKLSYINVFS